MDDRLPCGPEVAWHDEFGPEVGEERAVRVLEKVGRRALPEHDLEAACSLPTVAERKRLLPLRVVYAVDRTVAEA